ncbi:phosphoadenosine phosphosulfate reductase family protein [Sphingobacterium faecium]|uniref:phosphoadenosine phosphosulfate reductase domain-containing protein n=1 Tax=Sphingobacterium faecium TaxID=34087 RepID=UPI00247A4938|nr:phosphoadenosine phosphosulfate reductase family protein [Sphingobacterium faecium]WGQ15596.1 phosphoadenosine phosphosulfate reductase family protein [Sphingobacterium faecium]
MDKKIHTKKVINLISEKTDRVILFYSGGKDSIMLLNLVAPHFKEVVLVFMYLVPNLRHVDIYLKDALTRYPNVTLIQKPHWILTYIHKSGNYCIADPKVKLKKLKDIDDEVRSETGIEYSMFGMKKADSLNRRLMLQGYEQEAINEKTNRIYPLSLWTNKEVLRFIRDNNLAKPIAYNKKASSGVMLEKDCFEYLQKNYPDDLQKIYQSFPMSRVILFGK